jgi:hypothetical protein
LLCKFFYFLVNHAIKLHQMSHDISKWHYYEMECYEYLPSKLKHFYELDEFYRQIKFLQL